MRKALIIFSTMILLSCSKKENAADPSPITPSRSIEETESANACSVQDGKPLQVEPRRAVGTEPFWGARIEGRCVNYSHIEDQKGSRVWTRYAKDKIGETWSGELNGKLFELKIRNQPGCSDGMSDKKFAMAVELNLGGELRKGCAEPA